jgi:hypothetical protein
LLNETLGVPLDGFHSTINNQNSTIALRWLLLCHAEHGAAPFPKRESKTEFLRIFLDSEVFDFANLNEPEVFLAQPPRTQVRWGLCFGRNAVFPASTLQSSAL